MQEVLNWMLSLFLLREMLRMWDYLVENGICKTIKKNESNWNLYLKWKKK